MSGTIKFNNSGSKMIAHRGLSGLETENTCSAFVAAGNRSYYGIETDIHTTADGNYIIIHDGDLKRVAGERLRVEDSDQSVLRAVTLYDKGGRKTRADLMLPTLEEYLSICARYEKLAVLELKNEMTAEQVYGIVDRIASAGYTDNTTIISFSFQNLLHARAARADISAQFLCTSSFERVYPEMVRRGIDLDIAERAVTGELVERLHRDGLAVNCWTVDDPKRAAELSALGVDYITTNILE